VRVEMPAGSAIPIPILAEPLSSVEEFLARFSDDTEERQLEVVDGQPVVTPTPGGPHQLCVSELMRVLFDACPEPYVVISAPWDWVLWERPRLQLRQPDLVVVTLDQAQQPRLTVPPLLAVEVVSPSSFERDAVTKRNDYARAGLEHYWLVEPEIPRVAIFRRAGDALSLVQQATGSHPVNLDQPFVVTLQPDRLRR
jgi:Uma2 family endonuclease